MGAAFKLLLFILLVGYGLIFLSSETFAAQAPAYFDRPLPASYTDCDPSACSDNPDQCANSYNVNNCGLEDCEGGLDWTKYSLKYCIDDADEPGITCEARYYQIERVCSIGDKCELGSQGLNAGFCDCSWGSGLYKVCCSDGTSAVCENSPSILQDGTYPSEGQCPFGTTEAFCGFDPYPPCDSACSAPRQCNQLNRTYNQCCGTGLSQQVQEYVWDDGSGEVCNYVSGACNQSDPACGGSYNTSCTNLSVVQGSSGTSNVTLTLSSGTVPPVGSFSVTNLPAGASATFSPTSCTPNCSTTMTISTISSTPAGNYTISVNGSPSAAAKNTCTLTIPPPGCTLPTVDIKANGSNTPTAISNNSTATLSWTTANSPTSCTASGSWSGAKSTTGGSETTSALTGPNSYTYNLSCSNTCGSNSDSVTVNVNAPLTECSFGSSSNPSGISPNPVPYNSSTSTYSNTQISWSTTSYNSSNVYYYNPGSCTLSNCPSSGWTFITSAPADGTWDYVWNPNSYNPAQDSTHTIGITDSNNVLRCVKDVSFGTGSGTCPTTTGYSCAASVFDLPGGGAGCTLQSSYTCSTSGQNCYFCSSSSSGCTLTASPSSTTPGSSTPISTTLTGPGSNYTISCNNDSNQQYTAVSPGTYSCAVQGDVGTQTITAVNNLDSTVQCSANVTVRLTDSDCREQSSWAILGYAFEDTSYDPAAWPVYQWQTTDSNICYSTTAGSCTPTGDDCNDSNPCTSDSCGQICIATDDYGECTASGKICSHTAVAKGTACGTSSTGTPLFCDGAGVCSKQCSGNSQCSADGNVCTTDNFCSGYDPGDNYNPGTPGWCYTSLSSNQTCGTSPFGGALYCSSGQCLDESCKTSSECGTSNSCMIGQCIGHSPANNDPYNPIPEKMGVCQYSNKPAYSVCQTNPDGTTAKLCSWVAWGSASQCNVDYVSCTDPRANNSYCCGTTNIQGKGCQGSCYLRAYPDYIPGSGWNPSPPGKAGITVHVEADICSSFLNATQITDSGGKVQFNLARTVGRNSDLQTRVYYRVWADIPGGENFSRGTCYNLNSSGSGNVALVTSAGNRATCDRTLSGGGFNSGVATFGFTKIFLPWIQTTGGDVHSNVRINTPGGP